MVARDSHLLQDALLRFNRFFTELESIFVERSPVIDQFRLALLSREHVLVTGPPGTAKSQLAAAVIRRIRCERTGEASVFARQVTESTVQTDLVGPVDFKSLMETGRTEHFTDEGILGATHAFLDEVFDGRDMLLRATLNLLHERELKHGTTTTRGALECALMTSNRYLSEVVEASRETLLAFVDRIAFVSFVPRRFADQESLRSVVRRHGGGHQGRMPKAELSLQDIDLLQEAVEDVYVCGAMCDAVVELVERLDREMAAARRADADFVPTRYLSTRSVVRATEALRAIVIDDMARVITRGDSAKLLESARPMSAQFEDLKSLDTTLLLGGPPHDALTQILEVETDPRERRQLEIMRTEREVFARCVNGMKPVEVTRRPKLNLKKLNAIADEAKRSEDSAKVSKAALELAKSAAKDADGAARAKRLLDGTVGHLVELALKRGLAPKLDGDPMKVVDDLDALAARLDDAGDAARPTARWLRRRAIELLAQAELLTDAEPPELAATPDYEALATAGERRLARLAAAAQKRARLLAAGTIDGESDDGWAGACAAAAAQQQQIWDAAFHAAADRFVSHRADPLREALERMKPCIARIEGAEGRLAAVGVPTPLVRDVVWRRLDPLLSAATAKISAPDRRGLVDAIEEMVDDIKALGLEDAVDANHVVAWTARGILERRPAPTTAEPRSLSAWASARDRVDPQTALESLVEVALHAAPITERPPDAPDGTTEAILNIVRGLPEETRAAVAQLDLARHETEIGHLEGWVSSIDDWRGTNAAELATVLRQRGAALRLTIDLRALEDVLPEHAAAATALRGRVTALDAEVQAKLLGEREGRVDAAWRALVEPER